MKVLVCPDKFKGSLTALDVCKAVKEGIYRFSPDIQVCTHPLADGGDGMLDILIENLNLDVIEVQVNDPLFRPIKASYGISKSGRTAFVEMSRASGLVLLKEHEKDCLETSTYGTGEFILDALHRGVKNIVLGMGGSATNDAGMGVASALGYRFLDSGGRPLKPVGKSLALIASIDNRNVVSGLEKVQINLASDVQSPFYGDEGAAQMYGPQKGADGLLIKYLDQGLKNFARLIKEDRNINLQLIPGSGSAGGLGGGCIALLNARLSSGVDLIMDLTKFEERIKKTDLVITGEGKTDEQTLSGKVISGVTRLSRKHKKTVAVLTGSCTLSPQILQSAGISYVDQILKNNVSLPEAMTNGEKYLQKCAHNLMAYLIKNS